MKTFVFDDNDDFEYHECDTWDEAQLIADERGIELLGERVDTDRRGPDWRTRGERIQ